jgi:hypothetical protein
MIKIDNTLWEKRLIKNGIRMSERERRRGDDLTWPVE